MPCDLPTFSCIVAFLISSQVGGSPSSSFTFTLGILASDDSGTLRWSLKRPCKCSDRRWRMASLSVNKVLPSEERWLSSESSYGGFDSRSRQCEGPFFCSSESGIVSGSPPCAQYALRSLRKLNIGPMSTFR